ncbi:MAG TPA: rhodanese-like domain-containing protein [Syntrophorhabdaceae bacterium]|nr:rhodanese-like domain-containing protein [Syntrophorhabdaceae bacterium]
MKSLLMALALVVLILSAGPAPGGAEGISPVVTTKWLAENMKDPRLVVTDIRRVEEYKEEHIPGSVSLTYNAWRTMEKGISCQLPPKDDIEDNLRSAGIDRDTVVVIVGKTDTDLDRAHPARVAWTMKYAGVANVAILDGGYSKWKAEGRPLAGGWTTAAPSSLRCAWNKDLLCSKDCLKEKAGRVTIVDTRIHSHFTGKVQDPGVRKKGHIPGSVNLPYTFAFKKDGTFQSRDRLAHRAVRAVGKDRKKEIVILCCTGRFSPTWWFMLSQVLGYEKVSIFDGSMEEWCADASAPLVEDR